MNNKLTNLEEKKYPIIDKVVYYLSQHDDEPAVRLNGPRASTMMTMATCSFYAIKQKYFESSLPNEVAEFVGKCQTSISTFVGYCPVGRGYRIHRLHLCRRVRPPLNKCPGYDTEQSDGEASVMLELWGMRSTLSFPSLPGPLWFGVVAPDL